MNDAIYTDLKKRYNEIYSLKPQSFRSSYMQGLFNFIARHLKTFPFKVFIPVSMGFAMVLLFIFGVFIVRLVTILQYGF